VEAEMFNAPEVETPCKTTETAAPEIDMVAVPVPVITKGATKTDSCPELHVSMLPSTKTGPSAMLQIPTTTLIKAPSASMSNTRAPIDRPGNFAQESFTFNDTRIISSLGEITQFLHLSMKIIARSVHHAAVNFEGENNRNFRIVVM
jgi:hypothetical protein